VTPVPAAALVAYAPAKLNLGLEVLGRRGDGFHELATIFLAIAPADRLVLTPASDLRLTVDDPSLAGEDNLALRALRLLAERSGVPVQAALDLRKAIPAAAGLGGASSDAAAALLLGRAFWRVPATDQDLFVLAGELGSDVAFFLRAGCALASGRGDRLEPLSPPPAVRFVVVSPRIAIPRKTSTLYAELRPDDFSDGERVRQQAERLRRGERLDPGLLGNAFERALYALRPELGDLPPLMRDHGAPAVALSGAGPSHYAPFADPAAASACARRLRSALGEHASVFVTEAWPSSPGAPEPAVA
jgi:4-diphosphocytidyl-2-C-methyl-D-erythritol kinase